MASNNRRKRLLETAEALRANAATQQQQKEQQKQDESTTGRVLGAISGAAAAGQRRNEVAAALQRNSGQALMQPAAFDMEKYRQLAASMIGRQPYTTSQQALMAQSPNAAVMPFAEAAPALYTQQAQFELQGGTPVAPTYDDYVNAYFRAKGGTGEGNLGIVQARDALGQPIFRQDEIDAITDPNRARPAQGSVSTLDMWTNKGGAYDAMTQAYAMQLNDQQGLTAYGVFDSPEHLVNGNIEMVGTDYLRMWRDALPEIISGQADYWSRYEAAEKLIANATNMRMHPGVLQYWEDYDGDVGAVWEDYAASYDTPEEYEADITAMIELDNLFNGTSYTLQDYDAMAPEVRNEHLTRMVNQYHDLSMGTRTTYDFMDEGDLYGYYPYETLLENIDAEIASRDAMVPYIEGVLSDPNAVDNMGYVQPGVTMTDDDQLQGYAGMSEVGQLYRLVNGDKMTLALPEDELNKLELLASTDEIDFALMTEMERGVFNYYVNTGDEESAAAYYKTLEPTLIIRTRNRDKMGWEYTSTADWLGAAANFVGMIGSAPLSAVATAGEAVEELLTGEEQPVANVLHDYGETVFSAQSGALADVPGPKILGQSWAQWSYGIGKNVADMGLAIFLGGTLGPAMGIAPETATLMLMSGEASAAQWGELAGQGMPAWEKIARSVGTGTVEYLTEKLPLEYITGQKGRGVVRWLMGAATEGTEEVISELSGYGLDAALSFIAGHKNEIQKRIDELALQGVQNPEEVVLGEVVMSTLQSGLGGVLAGGVMGGGAEALQTMYDARFGKPIAQSGNVDKLIQLGLAMGEGTQSYQLAMELQAQLGQQGQQEPTAPPTQGGVHQQGIEQAVKQDDSTGEVARQRAEQAATKTAETTQEAVAQAAEQAAETTEQTTKEAEQAAAEATETAQEAMEQAATEAAETAQETMAQAAEKAAEATERPTQGGVHQQGVEPVAKQDDSTGEVAQTTEAAQEPEQKTNGKRKKKISNAKLGQLYQALMAETAERYHKDVRELTVASVAEALEAKGSIYGRSLHDQLQGTGFGVRQLAEAIVDAEGDFSRIKGRMGKYIREHFASSEIAREFEAGSAEWTQRLREARTARDLQAASALGTITALQGKHSEQPEVAPAAGDVAAETDKTVAALTRRKKTREIFSRGIVYRVGDGTTAMADIVRIERDGDGYKLVINRDGAEAAVTMDQVEQVSGAGVARVLAYAQQRAEITDNELNEMVGLLETLQTPSSHVIAAYEAAVNAGYMGGAKPDVTSIVQQSELEKFGAALAEAIEMGYKRGAAQAAAAEQVRKESASNARLRGEKGGSITYVGEIASAADVAKTKTHSSIRYLRRNVNLTAEQDAAVSALTQLAKAAGVNVALYMSTAAKGEQIETPNGWYDNATGTIYIDLNAGIDQGGQAMVKSAMLRVAGHELTHFLENRSIGGYNKLREMIREQIAAKGQSYMQLVLDKARTSTTATTREDAEAEVIADACEMMLTNTAAIRQLASKDKGLVAKIAGFVRDWTMKIRRAMSGIGVSNTGSALLTEMRDGMLTYARDMQDAWDQALVEAAEGRQNTTLRVDAAIDVTPRQSALIEAATAKLAPDVRENAKVYANQLLEQMMAGKYPIGTKAEKQRALRQLYRDMTGTAEELGLKAEHTRKIVLAMQQRVDEIVIPAVAGGTEAMAEEAAQLGAAVTAAERAVESAEAGVSQGSEVMAAQVEEAVAEEAKAVAQIITEETGGAFDAVTEALTMDVAEVAVQSAAEHGQKMAEAMGGEVLAEVARQTAEKAVAGIAEPIKAAAQAYAQIVTITAMSEVFANATQEQISNVVDSAVAMVNEMGFAADMTEEQISQMVTVITQGITEQVQAMNEAAMLDTAELEAETIATVTEQVTETALAIYRGPQQTVQKGLMALAERAAREAVDLYMYESTVEAARGRIKAKEATDALREIAQGRPQRQLSERQQVTDTEAFRRWFGNSVVVNEDGSPKVVYHQTSNAFTVFETDHPGAGSRDNETPFGIFLKSGSRDIGIKGSIQMPLYARITNPFVATNREVLVQRFRAISPEYDNLVNEAHEIDRRYHAQIDEAERAADEYAKRKRAHAKQTGQEIPGRRELLQDKEFMRLWNEPKRILAEWEHAGIAIDRRAKETITRVLQEHGYDGVYLRYDKGSFGRETDSYIAFHPEQVKSATDNVGTFDPANPDIRYSERQQVTDTEAFRRWFEGSQIVNPDGTPKVMYHGTPYGGFTVFREWQYFTENEAYADVYHNPSASSIRGRYNPATNPQTYAVFLNVRKPFDTRIPEIREIWENEFFGSYSRTPLSERGLPDWTDGIDLIDFIEENEYDFDGIILDEGGTGGYGDEVRDRGVSVVVRNSNQVKSATDNVGTFDPANPDIRYSERQQATQEETVDPHNVLPINMVTIREAFEALAYDFATIGYNGRPIVVVDIGDGMYHALTGSHRIAAAREAEIEIPIHVVQGSDEAISELLEAYDDDQRLSIAEEMDVDKRTRELLAEEIRMNDQEYGTDLWSDRAAKYRARTQYAERTKAAPSPAEVLAEMKPTEDMTQVERDLLARYQKLLKDKQAIADELFRLIQEQKTATEKEDQTRIRNRMGVLKSRQRKVDQELYQAEKTGGYASLMARYRGMVQMYYSSDNVEEAANKIRERLSQVIERMKALRNQGGIIPSDELETALMQLVDKRQLHQAAKIIKKRWNTGMSEAEIKRRIVMLHALQVGSDKEHVTEYTDHLAEFVRDLYAYGGQLNETAQYRLDLIREYLSGRLYIDPRTEKAIISQIGSVAEYRRVVGSVLTEVRKTKPGEHGNADGLTEETPDWVKSTLFGDAVNPEDIVLQLYDIIRQAKESTVVRDLDKDPDAMAMEMAALLEIAEGASLPAYATDRVKQIMAKLHDAWEHNTERAVALQDIIGELKAAKYEAYILKRDAKSDRTRLKKIIAYYGRLNEQDALARERDMLERNRAYLNTTVANWYKQKELAEERRLLLSNIRRKMGWMDTRIRREQDKKAIPERLKPVIDEAIRIMLESNGILKVFRESQVKGMQRTYEALRTLHGMEIHQTFKPDEGDIVEVDLADQLEQLRERLAAYAQARTEQMYSHGANVAMMEESNAILKDISDLVSTLWNAIVTTNTIFFQGHEVQLSELAGRLAADLERREDYGVKAFTGEARKLLNRALRDGNLTPVYFFRLLDSPVLTDLNTEFSDAQLAHERLVEAATEQVAKIQAETGYWQWKDKAPMTLTTWQEYLTKKGKHTLQITVGEAMSIYATWLREQRETPFVKSHHLQKGGFNLSTKRRIRKKNKRTVIEYDGTPHKIGEAEIAQIEAYLTPEMKEYVSRMVAYMSGPMAELGNEVSMRLFGIRKFTEDYYFPMRVQAAVLEQSSTKGDQPADKTNRIAGMSPTKRRVDQASKPLEIGDFTEVVAEHIMQMILYNTYAIPIENLNKVLNQTYYAGDHVEPKDLGEGEEDPASLMTLRGLFAQKYGEGLSRYMSTYIADLNGGVTRDQHDSDLPGKLIGLRNRSAVMASLSVAFQQPWAVIRACYVIDPKYFVGVLSKTDVKAVGGQWKQLLQYSGAAKVKERGGFDMTGRGGTARHIGGQITDNYGLWRTMKDFGSAVAERRKGERWKRFVNVGSAAGQRFDWLLGKLPELADKWAWARIWAAVKREVADTHKGMDTNSEEFLELAGKRFDEVANLTQVYDSTLVRSQAMRGKHWSQKMVTSFMAEPTLTANMLYDAARSKDPKKMVRAGWVYLLSTVVTAAAAALATSFRDDDDEKPWLEKYLDAVGNQLGGWSGALNPLALLPFVKDMLSLLDGYDVERADMAAFADLLKEGGRFFSGYYADKDPLLMVQNAGGALATFTGIPLKNIVREGRAIGTALKHVFTEQRALNGLSMMHDASANFVLLPDRDNAYYYNRLYTSMVKGDTDDVEALTEYLTITGKSETAIQTGVKNVMKERFAAGEITEEEAKAFLVKNGLADDQKDAFATVDMWQEGSESYSAYNSVHQGIVAHDHAAIKREVDTLKANGYLTDKKTMKSVLNTKYRDQYRELYKSNRTEFANLQSALVTALVATGYTRSEALEYLKGWLKD